MKMTLQVMEVGDDDSVPVTSLTDVDNRPKPQRMHHERSLRQIWA